MLLKDLFKKSSWRVSGWKISRQSALFQSWRTLVQILVQTFVCFVIDLWSNWLLSWRALINLCWLSINAGAHRSDDQKILTVPCLPRQTIQKLYNMSCICNQTCMCSLVYKGQTLVKSNNFQKNNFKDIIKRENKNIKMHYWQIKFKAAGRALCCRPSKQINYTKYVLILAILKTYN
jgi:hypothetical protein